MDDPYWGSHGSGSGCWVVNKGLTLGKRILIAGLVVSSAPVVVPPFLVISALGFACSIPYGLFLATYTFTEIMMPKLLPLQTLEEKHQTTWWEDEKSNPEPIEDETVEESRFEVDSEAYKSGGIDEILTRDEEEEDRIEGSEEEKEEAVDEGVEVCAVSVLVEEDDGMNGDISRAVEPIEVTSVVVEVFGDDEDEGFARETTGLLECIRNEGLTEQGGEKQQLAKLDGDDEGMSHETSTQQPQRPSTGNISVPVHSRGVHLDDKTTDETEEQGENGMADSSEAAAVLQSAPEPNGTKQNGRTNVASNEVRNKEEETHVIWEQINALRAIVGYTATRQATCMGELKALYVFAGVEPPVTSSSEAIDVVEVNGKLRNLKLIVGVK